MMVFRGQQADGTPVLGIGLSDGNWTRLRAGMPIKFDAGGYIPGLSLTVVILGGATEQQMYNELKDGGALNGATIHKDEDAK